jgi:hypothetical protein
MAELWMILVVCGVILYWQAAMRAKEMAVVAATKECKLCDVQLLDQTVHRTKLSMSRDSAGQWCVWRDYQFAYTDDGDARFEGRVTLLGRRVLRVALETFNPVIH